MAYVQSTGVEGDGVSSVNVAFSVSVTAGSLLASMGRCHSAAPATLTTTSSPTNTWNLGVTTTGGGKRATISYAMNVASGSTTVTLTSSTGGVYLGLGIMEFSGMATSGALDQAVGVSATAANPSSGNVTTTTANQALVGQAITEGGSLTAGSGWTLRYNGDVNWWWGADESRIVASTGTYAATFTAPSGHYLAQIATFKEAVAGGSLLPRRDPMAHMLVR